MLKRLASAAVALPIALYLIHLGGWPFAGLITFVSAVCLWELGSMLLGKDPLLRALVMVIGVAGVVGALHGELVGAKGTALLGLGFVGILFVFLFRVGDIDTVAQRLGGTTLALVWGALLPTTIGLLRQLPSGDAWVLMACTLAWGSDTGAYFAGRFFGKRKLYPLVSPNKTWAGAIGGVLSATAIAFTFHHLLGPAELGTLDVALIAPLGAAMGQLGDLSESLLKRSVHVKDSGSIMPGHGGLLDRIDALVVTAPVLLAYALVKLGLPVAGLGMPVW